jgi:methyltransferase (TIGR00027 family)
MEENQQGISALVTAYFRAYHAAYDTPKIFDDFLAPRLYTPEEHVSFSHNLAQMITLIDPDHAADYPDEQQALARVMQVYCGPITLSRSRYTEDLLEDALQHGVQQYVILGAGMDTFAFRRTDVADRLQVFEVDHPTTQAMKRQRLGMLGMPFPAHLHFVPVNFTTDSLATALSASGYDPQQAAFFSWLGVTYYLTRDTVHETLKTIASLAPSGSRIVFDYMDSDAFIPEKAARLIHLMQSITSQMGEPLKTGFAPAQLSAVLRGLGFNLLENLSPAKIEARYFQGRSDAYHAFEQVHFAQAAVR